MRKEKVGFAAFDKESGKGLNVVFSFNTCTYLTDDPDKVYLGDSKEQVEMCCNWYNNDHKNKKEFIIKKVIKVIEVKEEV